MKNSLLTLIYLILFFISALCVSVVKAADITTTAQGGLWDEKTTWVGGVVPTEKDNVFITSAVYTGDSYYSSTTVKMANLTVNSGGKIIRQKEKAGLYSLEISGNLINNGEIIDYKDFFDIHLYGNLVNNGTLKPRNINFRGTKQKISGTKPIESKAISLNMTDEILTAGSNLTFKNCKITSSISTTTRKLNLEAYNLTIEADSIKYDSYYGDVVSATEITQPLITSGGGYIQVDNAILGNLITGNCLIKSSTYAFIKNITIEGNLIIDDGTRLSSYSNGQSIRVRGNFTNNGIMNKDSVFVRKVKFSPRSMNVYVNGNTTNLGSTGITTIYPVTNGKTITITGNFDKNVYLRQSEGSDKPGGKVLINSTVNISGQLSVYSGLEISESGVLNMLYKNWNPIYINPSDGNFLNKGKVLQYHYVGNSWGYRAFTKIPGMNIDCELREWTGRIEGLDVSVNNGSTYPNLPGSTLRWWRVKPVGEGKVTGYTLKLYYDEKQLNGQKEKNLKAFRSGDQGKTWELLSIGNYAKLDTIENSITIGAWNVASSLLKEFGDFVISSGDGSVPLPSPIVMKLVGREQVRIGAPNRYTVHMQNVDPVKPSSSFFVSVNLDGDARFLKVEIPGKNGTQVLPIDSIGEKDDTTLAFYAPPLGPGEESSFDVIITALPDQTKSATLAPVVIWIGGVALIGAFNVAEDYITDYVNENFLEMSQKEKEDFSDATGITIQTMNEHKKKEGIGAYSMKIVLKSTMEKLSKLHPITRKAFNAGKVVEMVKNFAPNLRYRLIAWGKSLFNQDGKNELRMLEDNSLVLEKTASSDPNEKVGPSGFGTDNYISKAGKMYYTIFFENKKEATAPAYRIQITDTLSAVFDPQSVKFGTSSHTGPLYNWKMVRDGNILKWDIEGIELPPNKTPPEGEGYVKFSVDLKSDIKSGQNIDNRATIIFDLNEPITTNTWRNIIDEIPPITQMNPIKYSVGDTLVNVSCVTTDNVNGSGPGRYAYYVSLNNAPFKLIEETNQNSIQYSVSNKVKNEYRFYAIATDNVYNVEKQVPQIVELKSIPVSNTDIGNSGQQAKIYPNPTSGVFTLELFVADYSEVELRLYSVTGELIKNTNSVWYEPGQHKIETDISNLRQGIYFAHLIIGNKSVTFKVVKN